MYVRRRIHVIWGGGYHAERTRSAARRGGGTRTSMSPVCWENTLGTH
jgi:hypothetical protein